jgi:hypothetical protein
MTHRMAFSLALAVALAAAGALSAQEAEAPTAAAGVTTAAAAANPARLTLHVPERKLTFRRISPAEASELGLEQVPTPPDYNINVGHFWDCQPVTTPFGPTGLETCRLTLVICDDEGNCVQH